MEIKEGSQVLFKLHGVGNQDIISTCEINADIEIKANVINSLICIDEFDFYR